MLPRSRSLSEVVRSRVAVCLAVVTCVGAACGSGDRPNVPLWTVLQAQSITFVRGQPVRVHSCRGSGAGERHEGTRAYSRLECLAGARTAFQRYDTVAVLYVVLPLEKYDGPESRYKLTNVRFIGGPGVP
jgi:hypothetical protein